MAIDYEDDGIIRWERDGEKKHTELIELIEAYESKQKHGRWIRHKTATHHGELYCSICEEESPIQMLWRHCPNCGADMRSGEDD